MTESKNISYVPGVCNIGPEEIARRRMVGWTSFLVTVVLFVILAWEHINPWWRILVFFPAAISAAGFIQANSKFCFAYARKGMFSLGKPDAAEKISDRNSIAEDRKKGDRIIFYSILIGIVVAFVAVLI